jgi:hypothetical protein
LDNTFTVTPGTNAAAITVTGTNITSANLLSLSSKNTSGTLLNVAYNTATLAGATTGQLIDLSTTVTNAAQSVTGLSLKLPATTAASTTTLKGLTLTSGAVTNSAGTSTWTGLDITMPAITQSAGTLTSVGLKIIGGTVTSGTSYALVTDSTAGFIGLGTTTPTERLTLTGNILFTGAGSIKATGTADLTLSGGDNAAGTGGNVIVNGGAGNLVSDTGNVYIATTGGSSAGGWVGIGTTAPGAKLQVGAAMNSGTIMKVRARDTAVTLTGALTGLNVDLTTNYTSTGVDQTGITVGLNANSAATADSMKGLVITSGAVTNSSGTSTWTGLDITMPAITQSAGTLTSTGLKITGGTVTSGTSYALITDATAGNVGIGKTNPGVALDVVGAGTFSSTLTATSGFTMTNGALSMTASSGSVALTLSSSATAFNVNSGLFDIDTSASRVGIGTSAPGDTLDVMGTVRIDSDLKFLNSGSTMHMAEGNDDAQFDIRMSSSSAGCNTGEAKGIVFKDNTGSQLGHICNDGGALAIFANGFVNSATDVAENYSDAADVLSAGDVVALDAATFKGVKKSERGYQNTVLGVVSTEPGVLLSDIKENGAVTNLVHPKPVALSGRVPVKVSTENGVIQKGDFLTSSTTPGVAMKATRAGQMIGKALENYSGQGEGRILVYVSTTYADPSDLLANLHLDENGYLIPEGGTGPQSPGGGGAAGEQAVAAVNSRVDTLSAQVENILATQQQDHVTVTDDHQNIASLSASLHQAISDIDFLKTQLNIASIGAVLGQSTATDSASFSNLLVGENANLNNVSVLGTFNQGLLSINGIDVINGVTGASINTAVGPLRLQSTALAPIEFEGAKITMTPDGSIKAEEITVKKLKIDASDAAAATLGEGTLAAGTTSITINTTAVTANSQIFITPKKKLSAPLAVTSQLNGTSFTVEVDTAPATDIPFSWLIIDTH